MTELDHSELDQTGVVKMRFLRTERKADGRNRLAEYLTTAEVAGRERNGAA